MYVTALVYVPDNENKSHPAMPFRVDIHEKRESPYQSHCAGLIRATRSLVINWDAIGQGERSQFWDAKKTKAATT